MRRASLQRRLLAHAAAGAAVATLMGSPARAQSLAARVSEVRDGAVYLSFASRPGICGDGDETVRAGRVSYVLPTGTTYRDDNNRMRACDTGPVRVGIQRVDGETVSLRVNVGGRWTASSRARDLGDVSAPDAAGYLLAEARSLGGRNAEYALAAAAFADSTAIVRDLVRLVRDRELRRNTRQAAVFWLGAVGGSEGKRAARELIEDDQLDQEIRSGAIVALMQDELQRDDAEYLRRIYPAAQREMKNTIMMALSHADDARSDAWFSAIIGDSRESMDTRRNALFWLGQSGGDLAQLTRLYDRLEERQLREHFTFVLSQRREPAAVEKLIDIARHERDRDIRRQAFFWLGQSKDERARAFLREVITK